MLKLNFNFNLKPILEKLNFFCQVIFLYISVLYNFLIFVSV